MRISVASDHGGFTLKKTVISFLAEKNIYYEDMGTYDLESVDYPDYALKAAEGVKEGSFDKGIIICGTGIGVSITANKVPGIRAALCHDTFSARCSREHNNANVLTLGERVIGPGVALEIVETWLYTEFKGGRHTKRVDKITAAERKYNE